MTAKALASVAALSVVSRTDLDRVRSRGSRPFGGGRSEGTDPPRATLRAGPPVPSLGTSRPLGIDPRAGNAPVTPRARRIDLERRGRRGYPPTAPSVMVSNGSPPHNGLVSRELMSIQDDAASTSFDW